MYRLELAAGGGKYIHLGEYYATKESAEKARQKDSLRDRIRVASAYNSHNRADILHRY